MNDKHKKLFRAIVLMFIILLCGISLPHSNKSIFMLLLPPIQIGKDGQLYLSGLLVLISLIWCYKEIVNSINLKNKKTVIFISMLMVITTFRENHHIIKRPYYMFNKGLKTIELVESNADITLRKEGKSQISIYIYLKNHSKQNKDFSVSVEIPHDLKSKININQIRIPGTYSIEAKEHIKISKTIEFEYNNNESTRGYTESRYNLDAYGYNIILLDKRDTLIIECGMN